MDTVKRVCAKVYFHMSSVWICSSIENISVRFYTKKVYVDLKYHTFHNADYCISSRVYNLNIPYIALRVEINLVILSKKIPERIVEKTRGKARFRPVQRRADLAKKIASHLFRTPHQAG